MDPRFIFLRDEMAYLSSAQWMTPLAYSITSTGLSVHWPGSPQPDPFHVPTASAGAWIHTCHMKRYLWMDVMWEACMVRKKPWLQPWTCNITPSVNTGKAKGKLLAYQLLGDWKSACFNVAFGVWLEGLWDVEVILLQTELLEKRLLQYS